MHDVRVILDLHILGDFHRARQGDAADIVASQIHQHDMLRAFFWISEQIGGQRGVLLNRLSPRPGTGNGPYRYAIAFQPHQDLG